MLVRKINPQLWGDDEISNADAISSLATIDNELSVWQISDSSELDDIVLALALSRDRITEMYVTWIDENELYSHYKITFNNKEGETKFKIVQNKHRNLENLTFWELGYIAEHIQKQVSLECIEYFSEQKIEELMCQAITENRLDRESVNSYKHLRNVIKKYEQ